MLISAWIELCKCIVANICNWYINFLLLFLFQNLSSLYRLPLVRPAWRLVTRLTYSASWSHGTIPTFLLRSHGASSQQRAMESSEIWWRSRGMALCSGAINCWALAREPLWIVHPLTPTSVSASPEPDARRPGHTNVLPYFIGGITMAPGARWPTAPPTHWASVYCSLVSLKTASVAGKVHVRLPDCLTEGKKRPWLFRSHLITDKFHWHPLGFGFVTLKHAHGRRATMPLPSLKK